jgi:CBS-domain-containing membrane protein
VKGITMHHRIVEDLMTSQVVVVGPETPLKTVARTLAENDISAVPVVDGEQHPIGMVSEANLIRKAASQPRGRGRFSAVRPVPGGPSPAATAGAVMTVPVITARPAWGVAEAARAMEHYGVKRLPVVDDAARIIGIVSRSDLLRVFLRPDTAIREEILDEVLGEILGLAPGDVQARVSEGVVTLDGTVGEDDLVPTAERLCWMVDGVVRVDSHLTTADAGRRTRG